MNVPGSMRWIEEQVKTLDLTQREIENEYSACGVSPIAEQHFLIALGNLKTVIAHLTLAKYNQMRGE